MLIVPSFVRFLYWLARRWPKYRLNM